MIKTTFTLDEIIARTARHECLICKTSLDFQFGDRGWHVPLCKKHRLAFMDFQVENDFCILCGNKMIGLRHNPAPLGKNDTRCCDKCNKEKVIPERLKKFAEKGDYDEH